MPTPFTSPPRAPRSPIPWLSIDRLARSQHGIITHAQLLEAGLSASAVQRSVRAGRLLRVHRGVFRLAGTAETKHQELAAAVATTAPSSAGSHRSACYLWGIEVPGPHRLRSRAEVTVARARAPRPQGITVHRSLDLASQHLLVRQQILVTNPLRLLVDLGAVVPADVVALALAQLLARGTVTMSGARAFHGQLRRRGRSGCGVLGSVLTSRALGERPCESLLEERFAALVASRGIPAPVFQYPVQVGDRTKRIDFAYPDLLVALELDSWEHHGMVPDDFYADRARAFELSAMGWQVVPITWRDLDRRPTWVLDRLEALLLAAARRVDGGM